jgi:hypothetical protein
LRCTTQPERATIALRDEFPLRSFTVQTKSILLSIALLALVGATGGVLRSQDAPPTSPDSDRTRHVTAIKLLRALNTAELSYKTKHGAYATRDELAASDEFKVNLSGWSLRLNVTADGKAYDALLEDTTYKSCGYAALTDERGVIRQSKAIDCEI